MKEITEQEELDEIMKNAGDKLIVVDFWASWCGPCKMMGPIFNKLSEDPEFNDVIFVKSDVDESSDMAEDLGVKVMPTFFFFKKNEKVEQMCGSNKDKLIELLKQFK